MTQMARMPMASYAFLHGVASEEPCQSARSAVVEEDSHLLPRLAVRRIFVESAGNERHEAVELFTRHGELLDDLIDAHPGFRVFKEDFNGRSGSAKEPRATDLAGNAFDGRTLRPIQSCHVFALLFTLNLCGL